MESADRGGRRAPWASLSLERKLPILIGGFLLLASVALTVAGYLAVRRNAIVAGEGRVESLTRQLRDVLSANQSTQARTIARRLAAEPAIVAYASAPTESRRGAALEALRTSAPTSESFLGATLRARDGSLNLTTLPEGLAARLGDREVGIVEDTRFADSARVGRFHRLGDTLVYASVAPLAPAPGRPEMLVMQWRSVSLSARQRESVMNLLGSNASLLLGNVNDSIWTDFEHIIDEPRAYRDAVDATITHEHGGESHLARAAPVTGTQWLVAVEMPMNEVLAPVTSYTRQIGGIALLVIGVGLLGAWAVSRDITRPLHDLADGATAIAGGRTAQVPHIDRRDELGQLGAAFATMAKEVEQARAELEAKVEARTRELEATMRQLNEAQDSLVRRERLATLGQLASGVGHELRNPLGVMTNAIYYLRTVLASQPDNVKEYLDILHQQVVTSEKIVADLLDFTRSKPPQRLATELRDVVDAQVAPVRAQFGSVTIKVELPDALPRVLVDAHQAGQVVHNLLLNAAQAMSGQGSITIRALHDVDRVHLEVCDTGLGVPPDLQERIFEPLFTTKARGIGLGLALSRTLARANGGDLHTRNNGGRGATFTFTLPVAEGAA